MILLRSPKCPSLPITSEPVHTHTADDRFSFTAASGRASLGLWSDLAWSLPGSRYGNYGPLQFAGISITRTEVAECAGIGIGCVAGPPGRSKEEREPT